MDKATKEVSTRGDGGFGLAQNTQTELLTIVFLACAGVIIKLCFPENYSELGNIGPASSTMWGYGLTAIALSIMAFMEIGLNTSGSNESSGGLFKYFSNIFHIILTPIVLTLFVVMYIIYLNFSYFTKINTNQVTPDYHTYSYMSLFLLIVQIICIAYYLRIHINEGITEKITDTIAKQIEIYKSITYIICTINFIFIVMIHINLAFFSTDEVETKDTE